jgi:hypothetical protein
MPNKFITGEVATPDAPVLRAGPCRPCNGGIALHSQQPDTLIGFPATWRSGYAAACKAVYTGSIPVVALAAVGDPRAASPASWRSRPAWIT